MRLSCALLAVSLLGGCGSKCPEPYYAGAASDEAWRTMQDGESRAKADDAKAVQLFFPKDAAMISATGSPPTFLWTTPLTASKEVPAPTKRLTRREPTWPARLSGLLYGSAWAHLPPVTGPVHFLRLSLPGKACPLEVLTTLNEWTPSEAAWAQLKGLTPGTISFDVFSAYLQENRISEGPYHFSKPLSLTVAK